MNLRELRELAKSLNIRGYSAAKKDKLIMMLESHPRAFKVLHTDVDESADEKVKESFELNPEDFDKMDATELEARHNALRAHLEKKKEIAEATAPAKKRASPWNTFLKEYSANNGVSYKVAMSKKEEYSKWKESNWPPKSD
jgi:hypothetical protein